jgi:hypothetical protein
MANRIAAGRSLSASTHLVAAVLVGACAAALPAQVFQRTLTYTRFGDFPNIKQTVLSYDVGLGAVQLSTPSWLAHTPGADGILFAPDGDLIIGGQSTQTYKVDYPGFTYTGVNAGVYSFHVMLDPAGDDLQVTHIIFANGRAYYTASLPTGNGNFGRIDMNTFTTTRLFADVPWAHGAAYDCYTEDIMVFANDRIAQFDPVSEQIVGQLSLASLGSWINMDQGASDGLGHIYVASNTGYLVFVDLSISRSIAAPDFVDAPFLDTFLDDVAPDCGLGGPPSCPRSQGYWGQHANAWPVASLTIGCSSYAKAQCLALLGQPVKGDASVILAKQLIAAKVNVANSAYNWPAIVAAIEQADALLCGYSGPLPLNVRTSTAAGQQMTSLAAQLEGFNLGALSPQCGAPSGRGAAR